MNETTRLAAASVLSAALACLTPVAASGERPPVSTPLPVDSLADAPAGAGTGTSEGRGAEISGEILGLTAAETQQVWVSALKGGQLPLGTAPDADGRYRFADLDSGRWTIVANDPAAGRMASGVVEVAAGGGPYRLDLVFAGGLTLTGRVRVDGEPLAHGTILLHGSEGGRSTRVSTEADGSFRAAGLEPGSYDLWVHQDLDALGHRRLILTRDDELLLDLPTGSLAGRLLAAAGEIVPGAEVRLHTTDETAPFRLAGMASTDAAGRFSLPRLAPGTYDVRAYTGNRVARATVSLAAGDRRELELRLEQGAELVLVPRLAAGGRPQRLALRINEFLTSAIYFGETTLTADGEAVFPGVPTGDWRIAVAGGGTALVDVAVKVPGPAVAIILPPPTVLEVEVPALADQMLAPLAIAGPDGRTPAAGVGPGLTWGRWRFSSLPPGTWTVRVTGPDGRDYWGTATTAPDQPARLVLD